MAPKTSTAVVVHRLTVMATYVLVRFRNKFLNTCMFSLLSPWLENANQYNPREDLLLNVTHIIKAISY